MKTDKLYYRLFLAQPDLLADLLPGVPTGYQFEYTAPVIKETEFRLDGLLTPLTDDPTVPLIFIEAQMQRDPDFYRRFFAEIYLYLAQYKSDRSWRGLLILQSREQALGDASLYSDLQVGKVEQLYLQDLLGQTQLSPILALLQLIVLSDQEATNAARQILNTAQLQTPETYPQTLELVEAILVNKFPQLSTEDILNMLDLKTADVRQTRFYREVSQEGQRDLILSLLAHRFGTLTAQQEEQVKALSSEGLYALGLALFDFAELADFDCWLADRPSSPGNQ